MRRWRGKYAKSKPVSESRVPEAGSGNHPKRQHVVPQMLLRQFSIKGRKEPKVYFYDKVTDKIAEAAIDEVASSKYFYDQEVDGVHYTIEPGLSNFEAAVGPVVQKIVDTKSVGKLSDQEKETLADYVIKQLVRTKKSVKRVASMLMGLEKKLKESGFNLSEAFDDYVPISEETVRKLHIDQLREGALSPSFLLEKAWMLLETTEDDPFFTSDHPIVRQNFVARRERWPRGSRGIGSPYVEIYFPLSPTLCLSFVALDHMATIRDQYQQMLMLERKAPERAFELVGIKIFIEEFLEAFRTGDARCVNSEAVRNMNSLQCLECDRQVFSATLSFDLPREMKAAGDLENDVDDGEWVLGLRGRDE